MLSIMLGDFPIIGACIFNMFYTNVNQQVFYTDIEVIVINMYLMLLITIEICLHKEKRSYGPDGVGLVSFAPLSLKSGTHEDEK